MSGRIQNDGSFDDLNLNANLLRGIYAYGIERPSYIQSRAITPCLQGKCRLFEHLANFIKGKDVILQAKSGMGKTLVFTIALLENVDPELKECQAIVLEPTRELAKQNYNYIKTIAKYLPIKCHLAIGGNRVKEDVKALMDGIQIIVCTDGRLLHLINDLILNTSDVKLLVIDEFDKMFTTRTQAKKIVKLINRSDLQKIFVSATASDKVVKMTSKLMIDPKVFSIKREELTLEGIEQFYIVTDTKLQTLHTLLNSGKGIGGQCLIFCNFRKTVNKIIDSLDSMDCPGLELAYIHSKISQSDRDSIMHKLRTGEIRYLITSDLLSRGIDVQQIKIVINFDLPVDKQDYIHRIGRCGRYGRKGRAISLVVPGEEEVITELQKFFTTEIEEIDDCLDFYQDYQIEP